MLAHAPTASHGGTSLDPGVPFFMGEGRFVLMDPVLPLSRLLSGGQTGADRAALDFAIERGLPHGGWCPRGRLAEEGVIDARYHLRETPSADYSQRTEWNVRDSDGTVIFSIHPELTGGSRFTREVAERLGKPCLHLSGERGITDSARALRDFVRENQIQVLNVAGPRRSQEPEVGAFVKAVLEEALGPPA